MSKKPTVFNVMGDIIYHFYKHPLSNQLYAQLRQSIHKDMSQTIGIWSLLFPLIPDDYLSENGTPTKEQKAILNTLQIYSLLSQGYNGLKHQEKEQEDVRYQNIGDELRKLRYYKPERAKALDRRFNQLITATSYDEMIRHLINLLKIYKSQYHNPTLNYKTLANDLFWYQTSIQEKIKFKWAQNYYKTLGGNTDD